MDEQNVKNEKKKELLNIYWFLLMVMAAVSLVNLLAISTDSMKAAAIVNVVLLFAIPLTFVLGYIDFRNFAPMSVKKEFAYDATAVIALFISFIHFNVRNYTFMQDYTDENTYIIWVSVFAALYLAIAFICLILTFLNFHSRKKTNEILLRDGDCVDCQLRVPYRVQLQHDGYDILGAAETYGDSGRLRR